jgi:hypothetical protein
MRNLAQVLFGWISVQVNIILQNMFGIIEVDQILELGWEAFSI